LECENLGDTKIQLLTLNGVALNGKDVISKDNTFTIKNFFEDDFIDNSYIFSNEEKYVSDKYLSFLFDVVLEVSYLTVMKQS
jgi:hypothetical protein